MPCLPFLRKEHSIQLLYVRQANASYGSPSNLPCRDPLLRRDEYFPNVFAPMPDARHRSGELNLRRNKARIPYLPVIDIPLFFSLLKFQNSKASRSLASSFSCCNNSSVPALMEPDSLLKLPPICGMMLSADHQFGPATESVGPAKKAE